jgi:hypothetical protein
MVIAAAALLGLLLLVLTAQDAFEVMLLPRRVLRRVHFVSFFYRLTWAAWSAFTRHLRNSGANGTNKTVTTVCRCGW